MYIYIYVYTYACSCYTYIYTYIYINICMRLYQDQDKYTCRVLALPLRKELDFLAEEPYNQSKEPYIPSRPQRITILKCYAATQQIMHTTTKRAVYFVKQKEPYIMSKEPYILSKELSILSKEPNICRKKPYSNSRMAQMLRCC